MKSDSCWHGAVPWKDFGPLWPHNSLTTSGRQKRCLSVLLLLSSGVQASRVVKNCNGKALVDTENNRIARDKKEGEPYGCYRQASHAVCQCITSSHCQVTQLLKHCLPANREPNPHLQSITSGHLVAALFSLVTLTKSAVSSIAEKGDPLLTTMGQKGGSHFQNTRKTLISGSGSKELLHHYSKGCKSESIYFGKSQIWTHPGPLRMLSYILLLITVEMILLTLLFARMM